AGLGLVALALGRPRLALVAGAGVALLGVATGVEFLIGTRLGLGAILGASPSRFLGPDLAPAGAAAAPRLPLCAAGLGLAVPCGRSALGVTYAGLLLLGLCALAFFGYMTGFLTLLGRPYATRLGVTDLLGFLAVGAGLFVWGAVLAEGRARGLVR